MRVSSDHCSERGCAIRCTERPGDHSHKKRRWGSTDVRESVRCSKSINTDVTLERDAAWCVQVNGRMRRKRGFCSGVWSADLDSIDLWSLSWTESSITQIDRRNRTIPEQTRAYHNNSVKLYREGTSQLSLNLIILQFWMIKTRTWDSTRSFTFWQFVFLPPPLNWIFSYFRLGSFSRLHSHSLCSQQQSDSVCSLVVTSLLSHRMSPHLHLTNRHLMSVSQSFTSSSDRLMPWLCHDSRWKPIGQQHNLIFMMSFALTIDGWKWACRGRGMRQIKVRTFPGGLWFIKWTLRSGVRGHGFINRNFLLRTPSPAFMST